MRALLILSLLSFEKILHTSESNESIFSYPSDYTSGKFSKTAKNINNNEHKYYQKVVLDHDNVYRLKTFKKELSATPKILRNMINLEANLTIQNKLNFANKRRI